MQIEPGLYRHYKGGEYRVLMMAFCSETKAPVVVYRGCGENQDKVWVRDADQWNELVTDPTTKLKVPRFEKV